MGAQSSKTTFRNPNHKPDGPTKRPLRITNNNNNNNQRPKSRVPGRPHPRQTTLSKPQSFHAGLLRERDTTHRFDDIYEIIDHIGHGGLCQIYKIRKRDERIGGSSRPSMVRTRKIAFSRWRSRSASNNENDASEIQQEFMDADAGNGLNGPLCYALKVINLKLVAGGNEKVQELQNEVELLKTLDHRSIIKAYETIQMKDTKQLAIVMELCTGGDLYARIPYTERQVATVTKQVLSAVSYLHHRKIIHRDIKMENIVFESEHPEAAVKVIDFGLSKMFSINDNVLKERVGTLYSMSPETMQGNYTAQADLWSVGVCIYIMLSGEKPFEGKTPKELVAKVLLGQYTFDLPNGVFEAVSDQAKDLIRKLFVVKPDDRLSAADALKHPWFRDESHSDGLITKYENEEFMDRVRHGIVRYAEQGDFRKLALNVIAKKSSADEIFELRKVFDEFDTMNTGTITLEEFRSILSKFDYTEADILEIFNKVDVNRTNVINYTEFLAAALEVQGTIAEYRLAEAFDLMDTDDSGYISRENLREILGMHADERYIDRLLAEADFKQDGRISYEEFLQVFSMQKHDAVYSMYERAAESEMSASTRDMQPNDLTQAESEDVLKKHGFLRDGLRITFPRRVNNNLTTGTTGTSGRNRPISPAPGALPSSPRAPPPSRPKSPALGRPKSPALFSRPIVVRATNSPVPSRPRTPSHDASGPSPVLGTDAWKPARFRPKSPTRIVLAPRPGPPDEFALNAEPANGLEPPGPTLINAPVPLRADAETAPPVSEELKATAEQIMYQDPVAC